MPFEILDSVEWTAVAVVAMLVGNVVLLCLALFGGTEAAIKENPRRSIA
jgi:hypothetical protein